MQTQAKTLLAKLLANENLTVRHGSYETAFFEPKNRVLGLPLWSNDEIIDLFVGHEVGHALHTPASGWKQIIKDGIPHGIVNAVEDIRIEKLIQRKYPGLVAPFRRGYIHLKGKDFFQIQEKIKDNAKPDHVTIKNFNFIDRLNLKAKLRDQINVEFLGVEQKYINACYRAETWEEVVAASKAIYEFMKEEIEKNKKENESKQGSGTGKSKHLDVVLKDGDGKKSKGKGEKVDLNDYESVTIHDQRTKRPEQEEGDEDGGQPLQSSGDSDKPFSKEALTLDSLIDAYLEESKKKMIERDKCGKILKVSQGMSADQINNSVVPFAKVKEARGQYHRVDSALTKKFVGDNRTAVMLMVKEFELRKNAHMYARATISQTGSLDMGQLHKFRHTDDIFLKTTKLAEAKNHGMLMVIDFSGSMNSVISRVVAQTLMLAMFCQRTQIPFAIYGFSHGPNSRTRNSRNVKIEEHFIETNASFTFELLTSAMSKRVYDDAFGSLVAKIEGIVKNPAAGHNSFVSSGYETMNGTPLDESLIVMHSIAKRFRQRHKVEKLALVVLTDGESNGLSFNAMQAPDQVLVDGDFLPYSNLPQTVSTFAGSLVENMKKKGIVDQALHFFLIEPHEQERRLTEYIWGENTQNKRKNGNDIDKMNEEIRQNGCAIFHGVDGFDMNVIIPSNSHNLSGSNDKFVTTANASTTDIANAFTKFSVSKKKNRVLAAKFSKAIA